MARDIQHHESAMQEYAGLIFHFEEPEHAATLLERIEGRSYFTETVSSRDVKPEPAELCILSFDGKTIPYFCLARLSKMAVTAQMALKFSHFVDLQNLQLAALGPDLQPLVSTLFRRKVSRLEGLQWNQLIEAIKKLRPTQAQLIDDLGRMRLLVGQESDLPWAETVAQERDATRLALEIFGLDKAQIRHALEFDLPLEPAPFLKGLEAARLREDPMIDHDAGVLPGFMDMRRYIQGSVEFTKDTERITVLNVNRSDVERVLGVDLTYYTHRFCSYVIVQYKRLYRAHRDWLFDLNDKQFLEDLARMDAFGAAFPPDATLGTPAEYRLDPGPFYFKFCKDISLRPMSSDMIDGMYFPRDYLGALMRSLLVAGQRGGKVLGYKNSMRHFNNTEFIGLVRGGWIGSRTRATETITKLIRQSIEADHSVVIGVAETST